MTYITIIVRVRVRVRIIVLSDEGCIIIIGHDTIMQIIKEIRMKQCMNPSLLANNFRNLTRHLKPSTQEIGLHLRRHLLH